MSKLWTFGDSFSTNHNGLIKNTWMQRVADALELKLINKAREGCGNDEIYEKLAINMHKINEGDYAIIGMTNPLRYKLYLPDEDNKLKDAPRVFSKDGEIDITPWADNVIKDKLVEDYYFKIRAKSFDQLDIRYTNRIRGMQKELHKRGVKSILWKWYEYSGQGYQWPYTYTKWAEEDGHFGEEGHRQFSERLLLNIDKKISYWQNIYERYDKLI